MCGVKWSTTGMLTLFLSQHFWPFLEIYGLGFAVRGFDLDLITQGLGLGFDLET